MATTSERERVIAFDAAFKSYLSVSEDNYVDRRMENAHHMCELGAEQVIVLMGDVPADLAVILSCCVKPCASRHLEGVKTELKAYRWRDRNDDRNNQILRDVVLADAQLLRASDHHPVGDLLAGLLETPEGARLYFEVARFLVWAFAQVDYKDLFRN